MGFECHVETIPEETVAKSFGLSHQAGFLGLDEHHRHGSMQPLCVKVTSAAGKITRKRRE